MHRVACLYVGRHPLDHCGENIAREPHEANLFDIDSKYGDVMEADEVLGWLRGESS